MKMSDWFLSTVSNKDVVSKNRILKQDSGEPIEV